MRFKNKFSEMRKKLGFLGRYPEATDAPPSSGVPKQTTFVAKL